MNTELVRGDKIFVSKLSFGPRVPRSIAEIPWLDVLFNFAHLKPAPTRIYRRFRGLSIIERNHIIVFKKNVGNQYFIKRCIGLPGDILVIKKDQVIVNGKPIYENPTVTYYYKLKLKNLEKFKQFADQKEIDFVIQKVEGSFPGYANAFINLEDLRELLDNHIIDSVVKFPLEGDYFPIGEYNHWSYRQFGPLWIPKKNKTIILTKKNIEVYRQILQENELVNITEYRGMYYINGILTNKYTFKQNYYFMMGDNRSQSYDSRFWGFVAEENIEGKAFLCISNRKKVVRFL